MNDTKGETAVIMHGTRKALSLGEFIILMALLTSLVALSIDAMLPALDVIGAELASTSNQQTYLIISLFFAGMALGQLFFGPFADARGRRLTILVGLIIFLMGTLLCYLSQSMESMLIGRFIQAIGVSGPRVASMALIRDLYVGDKMARVMSFITVIFILVPMIAPLIGQVVMQSAGWRHIFTVFALVTLISGLWFFARQGETLPRHARAKFNWHQFMRSIAFLITHPVVMGASIGMGCIFGAFLAYLSGSQTIFQSIYDTGEYFPLLFATLAFSIGAASLFNGMMVVRLGMVKLISWALVLTLLFATALLVQSLFFSGIPPLWLFVSTMFVGFFFIGILFGNLNSLAMQPVGHIAGVGAAFIGSFTSLLSVPIAVFINMFLDASITPIAYGFLSFGLLTYLSVRFALSKL
ncbi:multidrug effflux MFS transporter [Ningiella sp. W23]|uniref:multidrug effflux MFS transporter n=1 Tax=Ningiella sp. W23 TaxID=3023715 RepID=UPI003757A2A5